MSKHAFDKIAAGLGDAIAYADGTAQSADFVVHAPESVDVRAIRAKTRLTQAQFAGRYGFSVAAVRDWEQARRRPQGAARILLTLIDREPDAVQRALSAA